MNWMLKDRDEATIEFIFQWDDEIVPRLHRRFPSMSRAELLDIWHAGVKILADVASEEGDYD